MRHVLTASTYACWPLCQTCHAWALASAHCQASVPWCAATYRFSHDQEALEVCEVLFAWDEKRGGDVVYAAGWNAKVCLYNMSCRHKAVCLLNALNVPECLKSWSRYTARAELRSIHAAHASVPAVMQL
jgi:hypothetical protein